MRWAENAPARFSASTTSARGSSPARSSRAPAALAKPWAAAMLYHLYPSTLLVRSEEHTSELQSPCNLVCRLLLEKKKKRLYPYQFLHTSLYLPHQPVSHVYANTSGKLLRPPQYLNRHITE